MKCDICKQEKPENQLQEIADEQHCNDCVSEYLRYAMHPGSSIVVMVSDEQGNAVWIPVIVKERVAE